MSVFGFPASGGGGDILPTAKYDARAGRWFRVERVQGPSGWTNEPHEIRNFKALFDLENVESGWVHFAPGAPPHFALVKVPAPLPPKPTPDHKSAVRLMIKLSKESGGGVREVVGNSRAFIGAIENLYVEYLPQAAEHPGKLPVVEMVETLAVKSGSGAQTSTNYAPVFKITGWAPRGDLVFVPKAGEAPAAAAPMAPPPAPPAAPAAPMAPPSTGATRVPPPVGRTPEPVGADDDFG